MFERPVLRPMRVRYVIGHAELCQTIEQWIASGHVISLIYLFTFNRVRKHRLVKQRG